MTASRVPGWRRLASAASAAAPLPGDAVPREKNVLSVVSEPGTRTATRVAVARLPNTTPARPGPRGSKNSTGRVRSAARALASWVLPARRAAVAARATAWASARYRADRAWLVRA